MPPRIRPLSRRIHRLLTVALLLLVATPVTIAWLEWSRQQREDLASAVRSAGGQVGLPPPLLKNLRTFSETRVWISDTVVQLSPSTQNADWLREHEFLRGLNITWLVADGQEFDVVVVTRLIEEHPLRVLSLRNQRDADIVAAALSHERGLSQLELNGSDLTDAGLQKLPIESLEELNVSRTRVTLRGLVHSLPRTRNLRAIHLDGRQCDSEVVGILAQKDALQWIVLTGAEVTDEQVELLRPLTNLSLVHLYNTAITRSGFDRLERLLPNCRVSVQPPLDDKQ